MTIFYVKYRTAVDYTRSASSFTRISMYSQVRYECTVNSYVMDNEHILQAVQTSLAPWPCTADFFIADQVDSSSNSRHHHHRRRRRRRRHHHHLSRSCHCWQMASTTRAMHFDFEPLSSIDCCQLPRCCLSISFWVSLLLIFLLWVSILMLSGPT